MESFVTARCFQLLKIKNGLFRREALYNTDLRTVVVLHCCTIVYYVFLFIGTERERSLFVMEIRKDRNE